VNDPHEGLRKTESQWPIHQINWQKSRYIYDLYYTYNRISKEVYDYCITNKIVDAALIAKWKKAGYERLCSTYVINPRNYKFGTVSICRVPKQFLSTGTVIEDPVTGCRGCASGSNQNIFGNKYGQYLAAIQIAREERQSRKAALQRLQQQLNEDEDNDDEDEHNRRVAHNESEERNVPEEEEDEGPVTEADGTSKKPSTLWAKAEDEEKYVTEDMIGQLSAEAKKEAMMAANKAGGKHSVDETGPPGKRVRST
jgi:bud site selection protein 31